MKMSILFDTDKIGPLPSLAYIFLCERKIFFTISMFACANGLTQVVFFFQQPIYLLFEVAVCKVACKKVANFTNS